jgi:hypothetical protein
MASCLVLVNDFLVGDDVDRLRRRQEDLSGLSLVAGVDRLANSLDCRAELRAQGRVMRACAELAMTVPYPVPVSST